MYRPNTITQGFTLLELTIVLIIIALIAGGIMTGRAMVRSAELQAVLREYSTYLKATKEFTEKYNQLPGDFSTAQTLWGAPPGWLGCPMGYWSGGLSSEAWDNTHTCNGDGNGRIGASTNAGVLSSTHEWWQAWQHLSNAGLIDGKYSGGVSSTSTAGEAELTINVPSSKLTTGGWTMFYMQQIADSANLWGEATGGYGHMLSFGKVGSGTYTRVGLITPSDALDIEKKIDDGKPGTGTVRTWRTGYLANCTENDSSKTAQTYKTSSTGKDCSLLFILGF